MNNQAYFENHIYFFKYEGIIRKILLDYKFKDKSYLYKTFTNFILKNKKFVDFISNYDIIIPVPISKKRNRERGYNQSYLLAKEIGKNLEKQVIKSSLYKNKNIIEQSKLNKEQRLKNIQGVYSLKKAAILNGKNIIVIDDIYTTGSTLNECCKTIKKEIDIKKLSVLTLAKD